MRRDMIDFNCIVQEGCVPDEIRPELASGLARAAVSILGGDADKVEVEFSEIPRGFGFRGGEVSTTSMVRGRIPPGCDQDTRVRLMRAVSDVWTEAVGCSEDELVVSARDREA